MAKRVFISFAVEDKAYRTLLAGQARHDDSPFDFVDMSVKEPWDTQWKTNCRTRIKGCDALVGLISKNTAKADGALWEIQCAFEEAVPTMLMWADDNRPPVPASLQSRRINTWSWPNLKAFLDRLS